ncbi:hypothetical protein J1605_000339 [Eschrichtius robustus]|uniref:Leukocyte surface antigen CD47 n=1 Tax=Eschrichtius robustus TaxID=9764 RepID=A0AB34HPF7_ESCRO|nr:hypothetical protein J1605_000339 [Eschrichtius robustus]
MAAVGTRSRESGRRRVNSTRGGEGARPSARARPAREGERVWGGGSAPARGQAAWAPGPDCDGRRRSVLPVTAAAPAPDTCGGGDPASGAEMWPLVVLLLLGSARCGEWSLALGSAASVSPPPRVCGLRPLWPGGCLERVARALGTRALHERGSAQLIFNTTKSVEYTVCNQTVVIPCFVNNMEAKSIAELYVKWKFKGKDIFNFDGGQQKSKPSDNFTSAKISPSELLNGIASLTMDKRDAVLGNYTCEVTELSREGETIVELKYRVGLFKFSKVAISIIIIMRRYVHNVDMKAF